MSDTYFIRKIKCAHCGKMNNFENLDEVYPDLPYKDEFGMDFVCKYCKKKNEIIMDFLAVNPKTKNKKRERFSKLCISF
jgi:phage FluMu protein Com